jgi:hypothetical protein
MKKIVLAFSCVFLMSGFAFADDNRYKVVRINDARFVIVDTKKERIKECKVTMCYAWNSWGK